MEVALRDGRVLAREGALLLEVELVDAAQPVELRDPRAVARHAAVGQARRHEAVRAYRLVVLDEGSAALVAGGERLQM